MANQFNAEPLIYAYTRADAIANGSQIKLSEKYPQECRLYKYPVYCTQKVWSLIESAVANKEYSNDIKGVIRDIIWMSQNAPKKRSILKGTGVEFSVIITGASIKPDRFEEELPIYTLHSVCGPKDLEEISPAITQMFPGEL